jgi:hypothetical protein
MTIKILINCNIFTVGINGHKRITAGLGFDNISISQAHSILVREQNDTRLLISSCMTLQNSAFRGPIFSGFSQSYW